MPGNNNFVQANNKESIKAPQYGPFSGNPLVIGGFPSQRATDAESISMSWHHHETGMHLSYK